MSRLTTVLTTLCLFGNFASATADSSSICCKGGDCLLKEENPSCNSPPICPISRGGQPNEAYRKLIEDLVASEGEEAVCLPSDYHTQPPKKK